MCILSFSQVQLVVHVGVSGVAQELNLESQAFNAGYCSADVSGCLPEGILISCFHSILIT